MAFKSFSIRTTRRLLYDLCPAFIRENSAFLQIVHDPQLNVSLPIHPHSGAPGHSCMSHNQAMLQSRFSESCLLSIFNISFFAPLSLFPSVSRSNAFTRQPSCAVNFLIKHISLSLGPLNPVRLPHSGGIHHHLVHLSKPPSFITHNLYKKWYTWNFSTVAGRTDGPFNLKWVPSP